MLRALIVILLIQTVPIASAEGSAIKVVAAENFYGDIAKQIGGDRVEVTSILANPNQDPHQFDASTSTARALADARIVITNGVDYDPWMTGLLGASDRRGRVVITAGVLLGRHPGDNPHLWYDPATMPAVARALASTLAAADPGHAENYARRLDAFLTSLDPLAARIKALKAQYAGTPVTATEPVFGYMADAIGLSMRNQGFQRAIMNDTEPSASDVAMFEHDLDTGAVRVLFYNSQVVDPIVQRLLIRAHVAKIPVVGVTETEPRDMSFQVWMTGELDALSAALSGAR